MPYRRLPNTDTARYRALKTALDKGAALPPFKLPYNQSVLQKLKGFFPEYDRSFRQLKESSRLLSEYIKTYREKQKKAKLYVSHFFQVFNLSILRGELPAKSREFFGLAENNKKIPSIISEKQLLKWGEKIIEGEPERIANGGNPVTNPTIAVVKVHYDHFVQSHRQLTTYKEHYQRASQKISDMRNESDDIILEIWNDVEAFYDELPDEEKREKAKEFGVIYFFRKNELEKDDENESSGDINKNDLQYSLLLFTD